MIEQKGDLWKARGPDDYVVITTNGTRRRDGKLVMGRGIALEASTKYKWLQKVLGEQVEAFGLRTTLVPTPGPPSFLDFQIRLIAFPVKYEFYQKADLDLILRSTLQLLEIAQNLHGGRILMPRPGCGNGKLDWLEVKPMLAHYLKEDRYVVFSHSFDGDLKAR